MRSRSSVVLLALAIATCAASVRPSGYAPKWRVGDWWEVKTLQQATSPLGPDWLWDHTRYDVIGEERVKGHDCFVLKMSYSDAGPSVPYELFYVRRDNWLIIRNVRYYLRSDKLLPPDTVETPRGLFGAFRANEPRLPRFPLQLNGPDTLFRLRVRDYGAGYLREVPSIADSALVNRMLFEGDTSEARVVRPTGTVYEVRSERAESGVPVPQRGDSVHGRVFQSLQLWSADQPWRVYEGCVTYTLPAVQRQRVVERSWLIASGHKGK